MGLHVGRVHGAARGELMRGPILWNPRASTRGARRCEPRHAGAHRRAHPKEGEHLSDAAAREPAAKGPGEVVREGGVELASPVGGSPRRCPSEMQPGAARG